jgi:hypothetical protein
MNLRFPFILILLSALSGCKDDYLMWDLKKKISPPIVTTVSINSVYPTSAIIQIQLEFDGNNPTTRVGVCYGLQNEPDINSNVRVADGIEEYQAITIEGLNPSTTYYARAFAENDAGVGYGSTLSFTTSAPSAPDIITIQATSITINSAQIGGEILSDGGLTITNKGVCYSSTTSNPSISGLTVSAGSGNSSFTSSISGLESNTTYYARSFATNSLGTSYGETISFNTLAAPDVLVQTNSCNSLSGINALYTVWQGSGYQNLNMCVAPGGYLGSCLNDCVSNPLGASVEFTRTFSTSGHLRFRSRCYDGNSIRIPAVTIDGQSITVEDMTPNNFANDWHYIKTASISEGQHAIRINWNQVSVYYDYSIDEIEFWE